MSRAVETKKRSSLARVTTRVAVTATVLAVVSTAAAFGGRWNWLCDLTTHWPVQISAGCAVASIVLAMGRRWQPALLAAAIALLNSLYIVPLFFAPTQSPANGAVYRAVSANVHTSNGDKESILEFIRSKNPDFFLVMEVDTHWAETLEVLRDTFPYSVTRPRQDNFGIALYSRHAITSHRVEFLDDSQVPTILATIDLDGEELSVVGTHPLPPIGRRRAEFRNHHLQALGDLAVRLPTPVVVLGDLNTTSWSPHFQSLLARSGLRDSRCGYGAQPTWPTTPLVLRIPIDHALVSEDLVVKQRYVGPDIGSDHLPIVVEFQFSHSLHQ